MSFLVRFASRSSICKHCRIRFLKLVHFKSAFHVWCVWLESKKTLIVCFFKTTLSAPTFSITTRSNALKILSEMSQFDKWLCACSLTEALFTSSSAYTCLLNNVIWMIDHVPETTWKPTIYSCAWSTHMGHMWLT